MDEGGVAADGPADQVQDTATDTETETKEIYIPECSADSDCKDRFSDLGQCEKAVCSAGKCQKANQDINTACDDGNPCTINDTCNSSGVCVGTSNPCNKPPECHTATNAICTPSTGTCSYPDNPSDGTLCGTGKVCDSGSCVAKCYIDEVFYTSGAINPNNQCLYCASSSGSAWTDKSCNSPQTCHTATNATCDTSTGTCTYPDQSNGTSCGTGKACDSGKCVVAVWKDLYTNYEWQVNPDGSSLTWQDAVDYCKNLDLDGHTDWVLPSISELRSLIRGCAATRTGGTCGVTDKCLSLSCRNFSCVDGCGYLKGPGPGGRYGPSELEWPNSWYWSSSSVAAVKDYKDYAWIVNFAYGNVGSIGKGSDVDARCVRLGQ